MNNLHLLSESPFSSNSLAEALIFISQQDGLLLTGDAVYALQTGTKPLQQLQQLSIPIYALTEDVTTRAVQIGLENVKIVDYPQFVELCTDYLKIISWL